MDRFKPRPPPVLRISRRLCYLLIVVVVLIIVVPFSQPRNLSSLRENWTSGKVFPSASRHSRPGNHPEGDYHGSGGPLSAFLHANGIGNDRTLFVTMANEAYIDPMVNFKWGLDIFNLGRDYLVLCLDQACLDQAKRYEVLAYDGYVEEGLNWHHHIARMKVYPRPLRTFVCDVDVCSSKQISTC